MTKKLIILVILLFPVAKIAAYNPETTHAGLAEQSVVFFNDHSSRVITDTEKEYILSGAIEEDYPSTRSLNHFYDPIRNIGINGFRTAKTWATDGYVGNDYDWNKAISAYSKGDKQSAFVALGHILHLVEDMAVPDHTRNDPHMGSGPLALNTGESSYENWAKENKNRNSLSNLAVVYEKEDHLFFSDISEYFDFLANYSNRNFFGDDSIKNDIYQYSEPKIIKSDTDYVYGHDPESSQLMVLAKKAYFKDGNIILLMVDDDDSSVLSGYFDRLGKQAILAGAGVIDLFFREGEVARTEYLKQREENIKIETEKAIELSNKLNNSNYLELVVFGASSILDDKIISPTENKITLVKDSFINGSKVAFSAVNNATSFASFTASVFAKEASVGISKIFASPKQIKSVASLAPAYSLPNISSAPILSKIDIVRMTNEEVVVVPEMGSDIKIKPQDNHDSVSDTTNYSQILSDAYLALANLQPPLTLTPTELPIATFAGVSYSPGFGGGDSPKTEPEPEMVETSSESVDKDVDNVVDNTNSPVVQPQNEDEPLVVIETMDVDNTQNIEEKEPETEASLVEEILQIIDITPPDISLVIDSCSESLSEDACVLATTTVQVSISSEAEDLSYFEIDSNGEISTTTENTIFLDVKNKTSHKISVVAIDTNDNRSESQSKEFEIFLNPVVINEIAWGGTVGHPEDEWIELYNLSDRVINLDGWLLFSKTDMSPHITLSGKISSRGYYLIERKNGDEEDEETESPIKDIKADLWISFGSGLLNSGENIILSRASAIIDEVPLALNWFGGSSSRSSERYIANDEVYWASNNSEIISGQNIDGSAVIGTPGKRNSLDFLVSRGGTISSNTVLTEKKSPYYVSKNQILNIKKGATLTIEPGVTVKFGDAALIKIDGKIVSEGTKDKPIILTSFSDDDYAGDLNGDGICDSENASSTASCPWAGSWYGLLFLSSEEGSSFKHSSFRYGGLNYGTTKGMIFANNTNINIYDSNFEKSGNIAVQLKNSGGEIFGNNFQDNNETNSSPGLIVVGGTPHVEGNTFKNNSVGLSLISSGAKVRNNVFDNNVYKGIYAQGVLRGDLLGNESTQNTYSTGGLINLNGSISSTGATTSLYANPMPYFISGTVQVPINSTLNIYEGVKIMGSILGSASRINVDGMLNIYGTAENPVVFSSNLESASSGSWMGLIMKAGSRADIKNAVFKDSTTALTYLKSPIVLENVSFVNNQLAIKIGQMPSPIEKVEGIEFGETNTATTSPKGLF